jgi:ABC-type Mn2+/Zn2+ transport system ATPase subunit
VNLIELRQVLVGYQHQPLLPPVDLAVRAGQFLGVVGPNGAGKTTLVRTMLGLLKPLGGTIAFPEQHTPRFGYVPQRAAMDLSFPLTAFEVALMGRYGLIGPFRRPSRDDHRRAMAALKDVGMSEMAERSFHALSGGQRQRVLVARALSSEPEILVLDEPTTGLDLPAERAMMDLIASFTQRNIAVVMVSHHLGAVSDYVSDLALLSGPHEPVEVGKRDEILTGARLTKVYKRPIAVRSVDGHAVIFVEHECHTGDFELSEPHELDPKGKS